MLDVVHKSIWQLLESSVQKVKNVCKSNAVFSKLFFLLKVTNLRDIIHNLLRNMMRGNSEKNLLRPT